MPQAKLKVSLFNPAVLNHLLKGFLSQVCLSLNLGLRFTESAQKDIQSDYSGVFFIYCQLVQTFFLKGP